MGTSFHISCSTWHLSQPHRAGRIEWDGDPREVNDLFKVKPGSVRDRSRLTLDLHFFLVPGPNFLAAIWPAHRKTVCLSEERLHSSFWNLPSQSPLGHLAARDEEQRNIFLPWPSLVLRIAPGIPQGITVFADHLETFIYYILNN